MKKGFSPPDALFSFTAASIHSTALAVISFSTVFMRSTVNGPVSIHFCLPTSPQRGSTVLSTLSVATQSSKPAIQQAAGAELFTEALAVKFLGIVVVLGLFLGVQVVEVAVEPVEAPHRRQVLVQVAKVVLAELSRLIPVVL